MIIKTTLRTLHLMWPLFLLLAAIFALADQFFDGTGITGAKLVMYAVVVYYSHHVILTGHFDLWGRPSEGTAPTPFKPGFLGLVFMLVLLPMIIGVIVAVILLPDPFAHGFIPLLICVITPFWLSLTFFGLSFPRCVWIDMTEDDSIKSRDRRPVWAFVGARLLFWNLIYVVFMVAVLTGLSVVQSSALGASIPYPDLWSGIIAEALSYVSVALTAAVLSHAFLRAYDLGPQGLIDTP